MRLENQDTHTNMKLIGEQVTGALGQLGMALVNALRLRYGADNVLATDIRKASPYAHTHYIDGPCVNHNHIHPVMQ